MSWPALQLTLALEAGPPADTPPHCRCCHGRCSLPSAPIGWAPCTWCEATGIDPEATIVRRPALELLAS